MRIGVDVRYLSHGLVGGVHTYVANFVPALVEAAGEHEVYLYADRKRPFELGALPEHVTVRYLPWRHPLSSLQNDLLIHRLMAHDRLDLAHFPANYGFGPGSARTVVTLHDAINVLPLREIVRGHPKAPKTIALMSYLHVCSRLALGRADLVLTDSEHARKQITRHTGYDVDRIVVIPLGQAPDLRRIEDADRLAEVRERHRLGERFVLADALKNPAVLVEAWRLLPKGLREGRQIVFFSRRADPLPIVGEAVAEGVARLLVRPSREDLIALYSSAEVFAFPSWIEGFGIPVLEAMACGAPVVGSDRGAIPEVAGGAALLSDAEDARALSENLARVLGDPSLARSLRERGFARAAEFSWQRTAREILRAYERVHGRGDRRASRELASQTELRISR